MSQAEQLLQAEPAQNFKMFRTLVGIGIICAFLIVISYEKTLPIIKQNKTEALEKAVFKVLPGATQKFNYKETENGFEAVSGEVGNARMVYAGFNEKNEFVGVAIAASGQGFQDIISILYGYSPEKQAVVGFYVLETRETPGLGDKIEKDANFLNNFIALDVSLDESLEKIDHAVVPVKNGTKTNPWQVDCITGATITSKAIANIIRVSSAELVPKLYKNKQQFVKE